MDGFLFPTVLSEKWLFALCDGGGTFNLQGGAIAAYNDPTLTISDTKFESNTAGSNVSETLSIFDKKKSRDTSFMWPGGDTPNFLQGGAILVNVG